MTQHLIAYGVVWLLGSFAATLLLLLAIRFGFMAAFVKHLRGFFCNAENAQRDRFSIARLDNDRYG